MKILLAILATLSIYIVSYFSMVYGWGLEPENMGWIVAGYIWMVLAGGFIGILGDD